MYLVWTETEKIVSIAKSLQNQQYSYTSQIFIFG